MAKRKWCSECRTNVGKSTHKKQCAKGDHRSGRNKKKRRLAEKPDAQGHGEQIDYGEGAGLEGEGQRADVPIREQSDSAGGHSLKESEEGQRRLGEGSIQSDDRGRSSPRGSDEGQRSPGRDADGSEEERGGSPRGSVEGQRSPGRGADGSEEERGGSPRGSDEGQRNPGRGADGSKEERGGSPRGSDEGQRSPGRGADGSEDEGGGSPRGSDVVVEEDLEEEEKDEDGELEEIELEEAEEEVPEREERVSGSRWWKRRFDLIHPGSSQTVREVAYQLVRLKIKSNQQDSAFDEHCRLHHHVIEPPGNFYPPSLHVCKVVLEIPTTRSVERHACVNDCVVFPHAEEDQWPAHAEEVCSCCGEKRFESFRVQGGESLRARKVFWYLGARDTIREWWSSERFCKERRTPRAPASRTDFWRGAYAERIDRRTGGKLRNLDNGAYEVGGDWGEVFGFRNYSVGFIFIRPLDLPSHCRMEAEFVKPLMILPGPKEPKTVQPYLAVIWEEFRESGPYGTEGGMDVYDCFTKRNHKHVIFMPQFCADTPARAKFGGFLAVSAFRACNRCFFRGQKFANSPSTGTYFCGYAQPISQAKDGGPPELHAWDAIQKTDRLHRICCARLAEDPPPTTPSQCGNNYLPSVAAYLPYFDMNCGFLIPIGHCALLGCVKNFWKLLLPKTYNKDTKPDWVIPHELRKIMTQRAAAIFCTHEAGRPYTDIVTAMGRWTMEDWLHWAETYSLFITRGLLPAVIETGWQHLRKAVLHYLRIDDSTLNVAERVAARDAARAYAVFVEETLPVEECTLNLHTLVCHAYDQETESGSLFESNEFGIERAVGQGKRSTKYRMTSKPELVIVGRALLRRRLAELSKGIPDPVYPSQSVLAKEDDSDLDHFCHGTGKLIAIPSQEDLHKLGAAINRLGIEFPEDQRLWKIWEFRAAYNSGEIVQSLAYTRVVSRRSYHVAVSYKSDPLAEEDTRFGAISRFLLVESSAGEALRVAEITFYQYTGKQGEMETVDETRPLGPSEHIPLESIRSKVIFARSENTQDKTYILPFMTTRKL